MKRVINGVSYNTDTSTIIARAEWEDDAGEPKVGALYQTRGGAFFVDVETIIKKRDRYGELEQTERHTFEPMTREEAEKWALEGEVELFDDSFLEVPEAENEESPAASVYFRMPGALKNRIESAAKKEGLSLNAWAIRCLERCVASVHQGEAGEFDKKVAQELRPGLEEVADKYRNYRAEVTSNGCRLDFFPAQNSFSPKYSFIVTNPRNKVQVRYLGLNRTELGPELDTCQLTKEWVIKNASDFIERVLDGLGVQE